MGGRSRDGDSRCTFSVKGIFSLKKQCYEFFLQKSPFILMFGFKKSQFHIAHLYVCMYFHVHVHECIHTCMHVCRCMHVCELLPTWHTCCPQCPFPVLTSWMPGGPWCLWGTVGTVTTLTLLPFDLFFQHKWAIMAMMMKTASTAPRIVTAMMTLLFPTASSWQ